MKTSSQTKMRDRAVRGVAFNWIARGCSIVIAFFLTPFLVHTLGGKAYGVWVIVMGLTGYFSLADAGMRNTATKFIAESDEAGDRDKIQRIVSTLFGFYSALAVIVVLVGAVVGWLMPLVVTDTGQSNETLHLIVIMVAMTFGAELAGNAFGSTLTARARFDLTNMIAVGYQVGNALSLTIALWMGGGLLAMACVTLALRVLAETIKFHVAKREVGFDLVSWDYFDRSLVKELCMFSSGVFAIAGGRKVAEHSGVVIVGAIAGPATAAVYAIGESLVKKPSELIRGVERVVMPVTSRMKSDIDREKLKRVSIFVPRILMSLATSIAVVMCVFGPKAADLWIEPGYGLQAAPVIYGFAAALVARQLAGANTPLLISLGLLRLNMWVSGGEAFLSIALGLVLTSQHGIAGMAMAVFIVQFFRAIIMSSYVCKILENSWPRYLVSVVIPSVGANVPALAVALLLRSQFATNNLWGTLFQMATVLGIAGLSVFLIGIPASTRTTLLAAFRPRRKAGLDASVTKP